MKNILIVLALLCSCSTKRSDPVPVANGSQSHSKYLYVSAISHVVSGCTITMVSDKEFSGSSLSDSGYVVQQTVLQGQTASIISWLQKGSTVSVYTYSSNGYVYFSAINNGNKEISDKVVYNGKQYYIYW